MMTMHPTYYEPRRSPFTRCARLRPSRLARLLSALTRAYRRFWPGAL